jgi:hypothetical protein
MTRQLRGRSRPHTSDGSHREGTDVKSPPSRDLLLGFKVRTPVDSFAPAFALVVLERSVGRNRIMRSQLLMFITMVR